MSFFTRYPASSGGSGGVVSLNGQVGALTLIAGSGISITPGGGSLTIATTGVFANQTLSNLTSPTAINEDLIFDSGSNAIIQTKDDIAGSFSLSLLSGAVASGGNNSGDLTIKSGDIADGASGSVNISSGMATGSGSRGNVTVNAGDFSVTTIANSVFSGGVGGVFQASGYGNIQLTSEGDVSLFANNAGSIYMNPNANLIVRPQNGTVGSAIRIMDGNATNYVAFKAANVLTVDTTWTLPLADGTSGQFLQTNGSGVLSFVSGGGGGANTALSNLIATSINQDLIFNTGATAALQTKDDTAVTQNLEIRSGDSSTATSGSIVIATGTSDSGFDTGALTIATGDTDTASPGVLTIATGDITGNAPGADLFIKTGDGDTNASGNITISSGTGGSVSGAITVLTGIGVGSGSGALSLATGTAGSGNDTGTININTGTGTAGQSGPILIATGNVIGNAASGAVTIATGNGDTNVSGELSLATGTPGTGSNSGSISLTPGPVSGGTRGQIKFVDGTEGTAGDIWTSTGTSGEGAWAAPASANATLSNLGTTSINSILQPATDNTLTFGTGSKRWNVGFFAGVINADGGVSTGSVQAPNGSLSIASTFTNGNVSIAANGTGAILALSNVEPNTDNAFNLGSSTKAFQQLYLRQPFLKEATNSKMGVATLTAGTVTVSNTSITANSRIFTTSQTDGGVVGFLRVNNIVASTSFDIISSSVADTSTVAYVIIEGF